jgi:predicted nucleotidyltransferase
LRALVEIRIGVLNEKVATFKKSGHNLRFPFFRLKLNCLPLKEKGMIIANEELALQVIKQSINELLPESTILLFGSRARRDHSNESDFDLMVITNESHTAKEIRQIKSTLRKKLADKKIPADIFIQSKTEADINKAINGHIVRQVFKEGILV